MKIPSAEPPPPTPEEPTPGSDDLFGAARFEVVTASGRWSGELVYDAPGPLADGSTTASARWSPPPSAPAEDAEPMEVAEEVPPAAAA